MKRSDAASIKDILLDFNPIRSGLCAFSSSAEPCDVEVAQKAERSASCSKEAMKGMEEPDFVGGDLASGSFFTKP